MKVESCNDGQRRDWERLVDESADATSGHLWQWREVVKGAYGFESHHLVASDDRGRPIAGVPFIFVRSRLYGNELASMPYIDYGGICHADGSDADERKLADHAIMDAARGLAKRLQAKRLHIRSPHKLPPPFELSTEKVTQHLSLAKTIEEQFARLPSERRNRLKRCDKLSITTEITESPSRRSIEEFSAIYSENMRDLGSPTHSSEFFRQVVERLRGSLTLILVRHRDRAIAAGIALEFRGWMTLPWTGATHDARPVYGSNALYWAGIKLGIERGCHTFDFGRSTFNSGIFEFKRQWGPKAVQAYWHTLHLAPRSASPRQRKSLQTISKIWKYMPLGVARAVGPGLRRGISN
ncbi:MAG TPA: GNAT family N-acetyltransferase [Candidatus Binataceae bacterium]|nr:GNAT family N-acetyltransferase [Candidatus Binataceae bacterium]